MSLGLLSTHLVPDGRREATQPASTTPPESAFLLEDKYLAQEGGFSRSGGGPFQNVDRAILARPQTPWTVRLENRNTRTRGVKIGGPLKLTCKHCKPTCNWYQQISHPPLPSAFRRALPCLLLESRTLRTQRFEIDRLRPMAEGLRRNSDRWMARVLANQEETAGLTGWCQSKPRENHGDRPHRET